MSLSKNEETSQLANLRNEKGQKWGATLNSDRSDEAYSQNGATKLNYFAKFKSRSPMTVESNE
jgi:hypothetical protein